MNLLALLAILPFAIMVWVVLAITFSMPEKLDLMDDNFTTRLLIGSRNMLIFAVGLFVFYIAMCFFAWGVTNL